MSPWFLMPAYTYAETVIMPAYIRPISILRAIPFSKTASIPQLSGSASRQTFYSYGCICADVKCAPALSRRQHVCKPAL